MAYQFGFIKIYLKRIIISNPYTSMYPYLLWLLNGIDWLILTFIKLLVVRSSRSSASSYYINIIGTKYEYLRVNVKNIIGMTSFSI